MIPWNALHSRFNKLKLHNNKFAISTMGLIVIVLIIYFVFSVGSNNNIPLYKIKRANFLISITESGELRAKNSISITAPRVRGNLKIVYLISEGTFVKPGDIVCKFDPSEILSSLKDAQTRLELTLMDKEKLKANQNASLAQMESQLKSAELSFELSLMKLDQLKFEATAVQQQAKLEHEKNKIGFEQTKQEYKSRLSINKSDVERMDVEIRQKRDEITKVQRDLELLTLKATSEGIVVYSNNFSNQGRKYSIGDTPWAGAEIITLPDLSSMESRTFINEVDISNIKVGQKVIVRLDAYNDSSFFGTISSVSSIGKNKDMTSNIKVFEVIVSMDNSSSILRPGMTTINKVIVKQRTKVLYIPQEAVFRNNDANIVFIKHGSGFSERIIQLGEKNEDYIVVTNGLSDSDEIALLNPNAEIKTNTNDESINSTEAYSIGKSK